MNVSRLSVLSLSLLALFELLAAPPAGATELWLGPQASNPPSPLGSNGLPCLWVFAVYRGIPVLLVNLFHRR